MATNPNFDEISSSPPVWMGDYSSRESILPVPAKVNAAAFLAEDGAEAVVGAAGAAANAVSIPLKTVLKNKIPSGTTLTFNAATKKFATLTADAPAGANSLAVSAIPTALVEDDKATYAGVGKKRIPSGTLIGRTYAERDAGTGYGPADVTTPDDQIYLTARDIADADKNDDIELYRHNRTVKENYLPGWTGLATAVKNKIRALYACVKGVN